MPGAAGVAPSPAETRLGPDDVLGLPRVDVAAPARPVGVTPSSRSPLRDLLRLPELTTPRVGASTFPAAHRVGEPDHDAPNSRRQDGLFLRRTATGVTVYVNGDPVNLVDPNGHNPCSYEGTGPGGCPHDVNWAQASQSAPGSGANSSSSSGGGSAAPRTYAQSRAWSQAVSGYYRSFRLLGIFGGGQACDADCALQQAEQQVLDQWSQGGDFGDFLGGFKDLAGDTAGGLGTLGKGAWNCAQYGHASECGHFALGLGMQGAKLGNPVGQAAIAQGVLQQAKCTTGNIAHCAGYALAGVGTAIATDGSAEAAAVPRAAAAEGGAASSSVGADAAMAPRALRPARAGEYGGYRGSDLRGQVDAAGKPLDAQEYIDYITSRLNADLSNGDFVPGGFRSLGQIPRPLRVAGALTLLGLGGTAYLGLNNDDNNP